MPKEEKNKPEKKKSEWKWVPGFALLWIAVSAALAALLSPFLGIGFVEGFRAWFLIFIAFGGMAFAFYFLKWILQKLFPDRFDTPEHVSKTIALIIKNVLIFCGLLYILNFAARHFS